MYPNGYSIESEVQLPAVWSSLRVDKNGNRIVKVGANSFISNNYAYDGESIKRWDVAKSEFVEVEEDETETAESMLTSGVIPFNILNSTYLEYRGTNKDGNSLYTIKEEYLEEVLGSENKVKYVSGSVGIIANKYNYITRLVMQSLLDDNGLKYNSITDVEYGYNIEIEL